MKNILFKCFMLVVILSFTGSTMLAQNAAFRGKVVDDQSAVMIGASVTVKKGTQTIYQGKTNDQGTFTAQVAPGDYTVEIAAEDFDVLSQPVHVTANMALSTFTMKLAQVKAEVTVQETANQIELNPDSNLTATVLDQEMVQQLPDDMDELTAYLTDLAGPRANAAGGIDFVVDGFTNGTLPPKDQILQIRINNNPFSSEFQRPGFGRIEIVTKPGTGQYHGSAQYSGRTAELDANPNLCTAVAAASNTGCAARPPYQRKFIIGNISGPIIKNKLTASFNLQHQDDQPSHSITAVDPFSGQSIGGFIVTPSVFENYNTRGQWSMSPSQRHILNFNLQYQNRSSTNNGVGGIGLVTLPEGNSYLGYPVDNAYGAGTKSEEVQLRETEILSGSLIHETRFEWDHNSSYDLPNVNVGPQYTVNSILQFGSANNYQTTKNTNIQFGNALSYTGRILTLKAGSEIHHYNNFQYSLAGFNGSYTYASLPNFQNGIVQTYSVTTGTPNIQAYEWTVATYLQTDWKVSKKLLLSAGTRYQIQTNLSDHNDIDPRVALAYQFTPSTIVRAGFGTFHQSLSVNTVNNLIQYDGKHQLQTQLTAGDVRLLPYGGAITPAAIAAANAGAFFNEGQIYQAASNLRTPYTLNNSISVEHTLKNGLALTVSFDDIKSVHLYRGRDINAAPYGPTCEAYDGPSAEYPHGSIDVSGCVRPNPAYGIINQLESSGDGRFDSMTLGFRHRVKTLSIFGNYTFSRNMSDTGGANVLPSNDFYLRQDWGISGQNVRHRIQTSVNYTLPYSILVFSNIVWRTGSPYNQVLNTPDYDGRLNQRLAGVPINAFTGPQSLNMGFNLNRTFIIREAKSATPPPNGNGPGNGPGGGRGGFGGGGFGGGGRGGPGGGGPGGGGFGGGRGGGPGGPGRGGPAGVTMTVFANTFNVLNYTNLSNPGSTLDTRYYGLITSKSNPRVVELGLRFNF